jgi:hypothetical protein
MICLCNVAAFADKFANIWSVIVIAMRYSLLLATAAILAPIFGLGLLVQFQAPRAPSMAIAFIGYTNSPSGVREAAFLVRNSEHFAVQIWAPFLCVQTGTNVIGHTLPITKVLQPGKPWVVGVPPPVNASQWRLQLRVDPDVGAWRAIKHFVSYRLWNLHLRPRYQSMPYAIYGPWLSASNEGP